MQDSLHTLYKAIANNKPATAAKAPVTFKFAAPAVVGWVGLEVEDELEVELAVLDAPVAAVWFEGKTPAAVV
jgi:hypothetical protein